MRILHPSFLIPNCQRTRRLALVVLVGLALAVYANTLGYGFALDDYLWVVDNPAIRDLRKMGEFFAAHEWYRPLALVSLRLDYALAGLQPWLYHAENILLHAAVTALVYQVLRPVCGQAAWLAAALFAVLPVHTEVVANVTSRSELLAALLGLLALWQIHRPVVAAVSLLLALLAKESAIAIPALVPLLWWRLPAPPPPHKNLVEPRRITMALGALSAAVAAYLLVRKLAYGQMFGLESYGYPEHNPLNPLAVTDWPTRLRTALMIVGQNLALCFVPSHLSADYSFPQIPPVMSWAEPRFLLWTTLLAAAVGGALAVRRAHPNFLRGLAWFLVALAPVSNLVLVIGTIRAERLLYLPSVGTCLVMAEALSLLLVARRRLGVALVAVLLVTFGLVAARRNRVWRTQETLLTSMVADAPRSANAHYRLAYYRLRTAGCEAAMPGFRRALELFPEFGLARVGLNSCLERIGELAAAEQDYRKMFTGHPGDKTLAYLLVRVCTRRNDWRCVAATLGQLLANNREAAGDASAWVLLGNALVHGSDWNQAEIAYRRAMVLGSAAVGHFNLAGLLVRREQFREAVAEYQAAEQYGMSSPELYEDWAAAQKQAGDASAARQIAARGLERFPSSENLQRLARGQ